jgi:Domain of unknown function (DUF4082)/Fibronectin type III domain/Bacterial Ig domain
MTHERGHAVTMMPRRGEARRGRAVGATVLALLLCWAVSLAAASAPARAATDCSTAANPIVCENALPGDPPSDWQVSGPTGGQLGDASIQGYATTMSVNAGQTVSFKINAPGVSSYHIDILRLGYYGGNGARKVASNILPTATLPQSQPACQTDASTGLIDCGNWAVSASWAVPSNAVSGVYIAHMVRNDTGGSNQIIFVVRNDSSHSPVIVQTSDETWEAYNQYGGNSLYTCAQGSSGAPCPPGNPLAYKGAFAVSYNRPFDGSLLTDGGNSYLYFAEYQMIRWLEKNGYNTTYVDGGTVGASNGAALLEQHRVFMSSGHDEYWSGTQYANVQAARDAGVNLAFFSGNEIFWKTRWAASSFDSSTPNRTLITYKETHFNAPTDPADPPTWTGAWADPRFSPPADGGKPANALTGQEFEINAGTSDIKVPGQYAKLRLWRNTAVASLGSSQTLTLDAGGGTLGYEWDEDLDNGFRPAGEFDLSSTTVSGLQAFTDYGSLITGVNGIPTSTATHHLTLYRAPSGALVFGAGTVEWAWGLDNTNAWGNGNTDPSRNPPDPTIQQATVNLLADMGVQPGSLSAGLVASSSSSDATPPTSHITSPAAGAALSDGSTVTISGTASDSGGGVVAGVEVSTDGGTTWHPATLTTPDAATVSWSYSWVAHGNPTATIRSRATGDSANVETPGPGVNANVNCPCSIWGSGVTPATVDSGDTGSVELGVQFTSSTAGTVNGIRYYKAAGNTGTHVGSLWTASGQLLASATFSSETGSGWQQVNFSSPVAISANTTYVAGYFAPGGHYSADGYYFFSPPPTGGHALDAPPLHALGASATVGNGVFAYANSSTFPTQSFQGTNYYVDVSFTPGVSSPSVPGAPSAVTASAGNGSATVSWTAPSNGGSPITSYTVTPHAGSTTLSPTTVSGSPPATSTTVTGLTNGTSYTFTVTATNSVGTGQASAPSNAVTPTASVAGPAFVQQTSAHGSGTTLSAAPASALTAGNRLVVEVGVWNSVNATAASVTDSAGDPFVEVAHFAASDGTEESVWTAPITAGGGIKPTITARPTSSADVGIAAVEYSGLSTVADASVVDQQSHATGTTGSATATVSSGATAPTATAGELAVGFYNDSGFGDTLTAGSGFLSRVNVSRAPDMEFLVEDQFPAAGATPNASVTTGARTTWEMATVVLKHP